MARVLVADDDDDLRTLMVLVLERDGHVVDPATDGTQAWALARSRPFDVLVLDVSMPGLSGLQVVERLVDQAAARRPGLLLVSALTQVEDVERGRAAGADDYLAKPFRLEDLTRRVRALAGGGPSS